MKSWAEPDHVEVWFLSGKRLSFQIPYEIYPTRTIARVAQSNPRDECVPYGDGCFHPQLGYIDKESGDTKADHNNLEENKAQKVNDKHLSNLQSDLIKCDRGYYFDMFCGKAQAAKSRKKTGLHVLVDISSSFRGIDFSEGGECNRKSFLTRLRTTCNGNITVYAFDTSIKEIMDYSEACKTFGSNNTDRIIKWIKESEAKNLVLITDISEFNYRLGDYLTSIGAKIKGEIPRKELIATDLLAKIDDVSKFCK